MRQGILVRPGDLEMREVASLSPGEGEVIVAVELALTCGTDLKTYRRGHPKLALPIPLGHEFTGTVRAVGAGVSRFREGDPVLAVPSAPCEACDPCRRGLENLCERISGTTMAWGAFADEIRVPAHVVRRNVFHRAPGLDLRRAALLEPLSCVVAGLERLDLLGRDRALVLGAGPIGLLYVALLVRRGLEVTVLGKGEQRLALARRLGAHAVIDLVQEEPEEAVRRLFPTGACTVVECVGRPEAWSQAMRWTRKGGEVLFYGGCSAGTEVPIDTRRVHYDALTLKGAFHFTPSDVRIALDLITSRSLPLEELVTDELPLERLQEALDRLLAGDGIKLAIRPGGGS
ncbi:MAG: zinc-binding dehydrogenase [Planctomycetota bacterium]